MIFSEWLAEEMRQREMTQSDLSRKSGISQAAISRVLKGDREPGHKFCIEISKALRLPQDVVLSAAGHSPRKTLRSLLTERAVELFSRFTEGEQQQILEELDIRLERKGRTKNATQERKVSPRS